MPRIGFSDIRNHRMAWILGYTFVGNGTNGAANAVVFQTAASTYLIGTTTATNGGIPVLGADSQVGATYIADVEKHYARKVIRKAVIHVASLQPSTANNMMAVVSPARGPGVAENGIATALATATTVQQTFTNVASMNGAMMVDSWETKSMDVTGFIAGGSGAKQNEFEIQIPDDGASTVLVSANVPAVPLEGLVPLSLVVSGNNTTAALQNTKVHAIICEMWVDLLDFIGGNVQGNPVGVAARTRATQSNSTTVSDAEIRSARDILSRLDALSI